MTDLAIPLICGGSLIAVGIASIWVNRRKSSSPGIPDSSNPQKKLAGSGPTKVIAVHEGKEIPF